MNSKVSKVALMAVIGLGSVAGNVEVLGATETGEQILTEEQINNSIQLDEPLTEYLDNVVQDNKGNEEAIVEEINDEVVKETDGSISQLEADISDDGDIMLTATSVQDFRQARAGTAMTMATKFYVVHPTYTDYVGQVKATAKHYKYKTYSGQPYYLIKELSKGSYVYREDGFTVYDNNYSAINTSAYKAKSKIKQTGSWKTKYTAKASYTRYLYAPANK